MSLTQYIMYLYLILSIYSTILIMATEDKDKDVKNINPNQLNTLTNLLASNKNQSSGLDFVYKHCGKLIQQECYQTVNIYTSYKYLFGAKISQILGKRSSMHQTNLDNIRYNIILKVDEVNKLINNQIVIMINKSQKDFLQLLEKMLYERECLLTYELINIYSPILSHSNNFVRVIETLKYAIMDAFSNLANIISINSNSTKYNIDYSKPVTNNDSIYMNIIKWHVYTTKTVKWLQAPLITILDKEFMDYSTWTVSEHNKLVIEATQTTNNDILESFKKRIDTFETTLATYLIDNIEKRNKTGILHSRNYFEAALLDAVNLDLIDKLASKIVLRDLLDYFMNSNQFKRNSPSEELNKERLLF